MTKLIKEQYNNKLINLQQLQIKLKYFLKIYHQNTLKFMKNLKLNCLLFILIILFLFFEN